MTILTVSVGRLRYGRPKKLGISEKKDIHSLRWKNKPKADILCGGGCVSTSPPIVAPLWPIKTKPVNTLPSPSSSAVKNF